MKNGGKRVKGLTLGARTRSILRGASPKINLSIRKRKGRRKEVNIITEALM